MAKILSVIAPQGYQGVEYSHSKAALEAAAAKVDITPDLRTERVLLAGFGATGRRPSGVHDPLYARLLVLREGGDIVALAGLDLLGFEHNDVADLRRRAGYDVPVRSLFVSATHTHSGPDTLGLWGRLPGLSGVDQRYQRLDVLVGNAAIASASSPLGHVEPKAWDAALAVNVTANWHLIREGSAATLAILRSSIRIWPSCS